MLLVQATLPGWRLAVGQRFQHASSPIHVARIWFLGHEGLTGSHRDRGSGGCGGLLLRVQCARLGNIEACDWPQIPMPSNIETDLQNA
jgi:hypothetical protein